MLLPAWAGAGLGGCRLFETHDIATPSAAAIRAAAPSPDSITIEVLFVHIPDPQLARLDEVWLSADEQIIDPGVRRELARNGFRAGVIGPAPPRGLAELLQQEAGEPLPDSLWQSVPLDKRPTITGHRLSMRPHKRLEVQLEPVHDLAPLFVGTDLGLAGREYPLAQGKYALQWTHLPGGRIQVEVTPELHHGLPTTRYVVGDGIDMNRQVTKECDVFKQLRIQVPLAAGQMLLISSDDQGGGSLGHFFHWVPSPAGSQQRLVIVRLAQVPDPL
jgi:hypothetical protein